jgi:integrase/recombinase XerD
MKLSKAVEGYALYARTELAPDTVRHYLITLTKVVEHLNDPELESITEEDLLKYFEFLRTDYRPHRFTRKLPEGQEPRDPGPMSPAGVDGYWKAIRSLFTWTDKKFRTGRPDKDIAQPKYQLAEVEAFSADEVKKLIYFAEWMNAVRGTGETKRMYRVHCHNHKRDVAMVMFLLDSGMRIGEVCRARCEDFNETSGSLVVRPFGRSVKSKPRTVYLGKEATHAMWVYMADRSYDKEDRLFELNEKSIRQLLRSLGTRAGVENVHPHRFRHTFAIEFLRHNHDPFALMRLLGHSNLDMTNHYLNILGGDLENAQRNGSPVDHMRRK